MNKSTSGAIAYTIWRLGSAMVKGGFALVILLTGVGIVWNSLPYFSSLNVGFLRTKATIFYKAAYLSAFYAHISVGFIVLATGLLQFSRRMMCRFKAWHRLAGKVYIVLVLSIMAPSGLIMGVYANGGFTTQLCFVLLASLWWYYTAQAYRAIRKGKVAAHSTFMYRSYALTLSAVALRIYSFLGVYCWGLQGPEVYQVLVWLSWVPNLLLVELYFHSKRATTAPALSALPAARGGASSETG